MAFPLIAALGRRLRRPVSCMAAPGSSGVLTPGCAAPGPVLWNGGQAWPTFERTPPGVAPGHPRPPAIAIRPSSSVGGGRTARLPERGPRARGRGRRVNESPKASYGAAKDIRQASGALRRLEQLAAEATHEPPRELIGEAIDAVVFMSRTGGARRVDEALRVTGFDGRHYVTQPLSAPKPTLVRHGETT